MHRSGDVERRMPFKISPAHVFRNDREHGSGLFENLVGLLPRELVIGHKRGPQGDNLIDTRLDFVTETLARKSSANKNGLIKEKTEDHCASHITERRKRAVLIPALNG